MSNHVGSCRYEEDGKIFFRVYGFFAHGPDSITGCYGDAKRYQAESTSEDDDKFCNALYRRLKRRECWRSTLAAFKNLFSNNSTQRKS